MSIEELWQDLKNYFLDMNGIAKQGESLKINKKMFAMLSKGNIVVKLPKERVEELLENKIGNPYDPGNGKIMKEWVILNLHDFNELKEYFTEARDFAKSLAK